MSVTPGWMHIQRFPIKSMTSRLRLCLSLSVLSVSIAILCWVCLGVTKKMVSFF